MPSDKEIFARARETANNAKAKAKRLGWNKSRCAQEWWNAYRSSISNQFKAKEQRIRQEAEEEGYLKALCKSLNIVSETLRETGLADRVRKFMLATKRKMEEELKTKKDFNPKFIAETKEAMKEKSEKTTVNGLFEEGESGREAVATKRNASQRGNLKADTAAANSYNPDMWGYVGKPNRTCKQCGKRFGWNPHPNWTFQNTNYCKECKSKIARHNKKKNLGGKK